MHIKTTSIPRCTHVATAASGATVFCGLESVSHINFAVMRLLIIQDRMHCTYLRQLLELHDVGCVLPVQFYARLCSCLPAPVSTIPWSEIKKVTPLTQQLIIFELREHMCLTMYSANSREFLSAVCKVASHEGSAQGDAIEVC